MWNLFAENLKVFSLYITTHYHRRFQVSHYENASAVILKATNNLYGDENTHRNTLIMN